MNTQKDILSTLAYFDMFDYPLRKREIFLFLPGKSDCKVFDKAIRELLVKSVIYKMGDFYSLRNKYELLYRRKQGNEKAKDLMAIAEKVSAFLAKFPYVRGVGISGSLSKGFADDDSDIDFFVITQKNRLWIARTILHCFKKLTFLVNKQHLFCMNYFIDEAMLEINEKNIYTATEVVTLFPLDGYTAFNTFYAVNSWTKSFLPNNYLKIASAKEKISSNFKRFMEAPFNNIAGELLDKLLMKITAKRWRIKTKKAKVNNHGIIMSMHSSRHFAKPDPTFYQDKLLQLFTARKKETFAKYENSVASQLSKM